MTEQISRDEAKAAGLKRYFLGVPCLHGHVAERLVSSKGCVVCEEERRRKSRAENPEAWRGYGRKAYAKNPDLMRERTQKQRDKNPEVTRERCRKWFAANPEYAREYHEANAEQRRASVLRKGLIPPKTSRAYTTNRKASAPAVG